MGWSNDFVTRILPTQGGVCLLFLLRTQVTTLLCNDANSSSSAVQLLRETLDTLQRKALPELDTLSSKNVPPGINRNAYIVLVGIRRRVGDALIKDAGWAEYYRGLTLALLQILKFEDYSQRAKHLALIGAGVTLQWAGLKEVKSVHRPTRPLFRWKLNMLLGVLCVFAVLGWYYFPDLWGTSIVTSKPVFSVAMPVAGCTRDVAKIGELGTPALGSSILQRVKDRGVLLCGVEGGLTNFSHIHSNELPISDLPGFFANASGLDADFCRVVATAVFGSYHGRVAFTKLEAGNRFNALVDRKVDVLFRNTTWTAGRDAGTDGNPQGIDFGTVTFYDGQRFLVVEEENIDSLTELKSQTVCVQEGTTTLSNTIALSNELRLDLDIIPISKEKSTEGMLSSFGVECKVMAGDTSQLATRGKEITGYIMPVDAPISFEPLAPAMVEDSEWRDIVNYAIWTTIYAEMIDVTQDNVDQWRNPDTTRPISQEFVNSGNKLGQALGLKANSDFVYNIIKRFGNYGEIYACNLGDVKALQNRGPNQPALWYDFTTNSWRQNPGGLLIAPPFGR